MNTLKLNNAQRYRLRELWATAWRAERDFVDAEHAYAMHCEQQNDMGDDDLAESAGASPSVDKIEARRSLAVRQRDTARANLCAGYAQHLGGEGGQLIGELLAAIDACYEPGGVLLRYPVMGERGDELQERVQAVKGRVNALVGGELIMVDPDPNA